MSVSVYQPGCLVKCREREWVVLPSEDADLLRLRPLGGSEQETCGIYLPLNLEPIEEATFPPPTSTHVGDHTSAQLLADATRLSFRSGAGPFRCLGRISVRPRPYQTVPLLMGLRLETVRLLIADDVGVGKTVEAALIARELLDRGEVRRLAVVCPPHLCDQWQQELAEKFHIEAEVVRSSTAAQLERRLPRQNLSIFEHYPFLVVSIDYVKSERRRDAFVAHCPDMVIVDEVHTCARPAGRSAGQQQRHELIVALAKKATRHLLLLTATPHSGIEESFLSLLGLLRPEFAHLSLNALAERDRVQLARHFIQRRRADVKVWLGEETPFPDRDPSELAYALSPEYRRLFDDVYAFARELVRSGEALGGARQRVRYWTALALLRCVMSSPAAAEATLLARARQTVESEETEADDGLFAPYIYDSMDQETSEDVAPAHVVDQGEQTLPDSERQRLRAFARRAAALKGNADEKLRAAARAVTALLAAGFQPILYCRYIATADYVAAELRRLLQDKEVRVLAVTGALSDEERRDRIQELGLAPKRVLVATDCMSEGINLQTAFNAVIHYDLPWNPNRLEQREGRVDRYGQPSPQVKTVLLYGKDNPIDGVLLDVLLRKAVAIHRTLGVSVPVPFDSEALIKTMVKSLFLRGGRPVDNGQLTFDLEMSSVADLHKEWDRTAARERQSRTRFAQRSIRPDEVQRELEETDAVLGDPGTVARFVRAACERLRAPLHAEGNKGKAWRLDTTGLPLSVQERASTTGEMRICFDTPVPEGVSYIGRNHPFTAALADYLLDSAFDTSRTEPLAARCGLIRTNLVEKRTTLLMLRVRFLLEEGVDSLPVLAEELIIAGYCGRPGNTTMLTGEEALRLLTTAKATGNVTAEERQRLLGDAIAWLSELTPQYEALAAESADRLRDAHRRVRQITEAHLRGFKVRPQLPLDTLGIYVLMPIPQGVQR